MSATAFLTRKGGAISRDPSQGLRAAALKRLVLAAAVALLGFLVAGSPACAASNKVRITNLADAIFGSVANLGIDAIRSQNVCLYSDTTSHGYNITAMGTGPGGSFQLSSGPNAMSYEVQWSSSSSQSSGAQLSPNVPLTGQVSAAIQQTCGNGPASSASLIILLRSAALSSARAGTYNGTLTLVVGPE